MARIPAPNYSESSANSYRLAMMGDGGGYGMGDPGMQAWASQAQTYRTMYVQYLHQLSQGGVDASEQQAYSTVQGYLQQLNGWLSEYGMDSGPSGDWDPMMGGDMGGYGPMTGSADGGMGVPQTQQANLGFDVSFQDSTHIVTEEGQAVIDAGRSSPETRTIDAFQKNVTVHAGESANVNVTRQPDDSIPGKSMLVITINYPNGGPSRTIKLHNAERDGTNWTLAVDPSQVTWDASVGDLQDKLHVSEDGATANQGPAHPDDTVPDRTDDHTHTTIFNNSSDVDYHVFDSDNPNIDITAPGTVTLHGQSFGDKVQIVDYDATAHEWTIKFYKDGDENQCKTIKIHGEAHTKVILDVMGQSSVISGFGTDPDHTPITETDATKLASVQIGTNGTGNTNGTDGPINPDHPDDTVPSRVDQATHTATYDEDANPTITNYFNTGSPDTYEITASGTVTLQPSRQSDQFHVSMETVDGVVKYKIEATGTDENGNSRTITYYVKADQVDKIVFANVDAIQVPLDDPSLTDAQKAKIQIGTDDQQNPNAAYPQVLQDLASFSGATMDQIITALKAQNVTAPADPAQFSQWLQNTSNWLPNPPDARVIQMLFTVDPTLNHLFTELTSNPNASDASTKYQQVHARLAEDLKKLYPTEPDIQYNNTTPPTIHFHGHNYSILDLTSLIGPGLLLNPGQLNITISNLTFMQAS